MRDDRVEMNAWRATNFSDQLAQNCFLEIMVVVGDLDKRLRTADNVPQIVQIEPAFIVKYRQSVHRDPRGNRAIATKCGLVAGVRAAIA